MTTTQPTTRREANKARTREALLDALRSQLLERGLTAVSVEDVAEAAGVSRRTFFNYFTSMESALSEAISVPIADLARSLALRPAHEPPLVAVRRVLKESPLPREMLRWIAAVQCSDPERHGIAINVWAYHREQLEGIFRERLGDVDELTVSTLTGTVMAIFESAERVWLQPGTLAGAELGAEVTDASATRFNALLQHGLELASSGWGQPEHVPPRE